jgi:hypothetical protein
LFHHKEFLPVLEFEIEIVTFEVENVTTTQLKVLLAGNDPYGNLLDASLAYRIRPLVPSRESKTEGDVTKLLQRWRAGDRAAESD